MSILNDSKNLKEICKKICVYMNIGTSDGNLLFSNQSNTLVINNAMYYIDSFGSLVVRDLKGVTTVFNKEYWVCLSEGIADIGPE